MHYSLVSTVTSYTILSDSSSTLKRNDKDERNRFIHINQSSIDHWYIIFILTFTSHFTLSKSLSYDYSHDETVTNHFVPYTTMNVIWIIWYGQISQLRDNHSLTIWLLSVLCSGLTEKTKIVFISSNSSFTKCVRTQLGLPSSLFTHINNNLDPYTGCIITHSHIVECEDYQSASEWNKEISSSSIFKSCFWIECSGNPSGAISCHTSGASVIIHTCIFLHCTSSAPLSSFAFASISGAVYVKAIKEIRVDASSFHYCSAPQNVSDNEGAGAICINAVTQDISIAHSDFISCFTGSSGGGVQFESLQTSAVGPQTVMSCIFVQCVGKGSSPDGGALSLWHSSYTIGCTDCLFSECSADTGGALVLGYSPSTADHPLRYLFFNKNSGITGNDVCIYYDSVANSGVLFSCFSSSKPRRVGFWKVDWSVNTTLTHDEWLPQTNDIIKVFGPLVSTSIISTEQY